MELERKVSSTDNTAYATAYAQQIVDHFAKALQENGCLIQVPASLYIELDNLHNQITDYIDSAVNSASLIDDDSKNGKQDENQNGQNDNDNTTENGITNAAVASAIRKVSNDCFNCSIPKPKFDFSGIFDRLIADIQSALSQFEHMFKYKKSNICQYSYFFSYLCIPDLLKLLSLILAAIVKLMSNINLPRITIAAFINGILSAIIEALVKNIAILARFALTPVLCILDAIDSIINQLPTPENIRQSSSEDLKKLGVSEEFLNGAYDTNLKKQTATIRDAYSSRVNNLSNTATSSIQSYAEETFAPLKNTINKSVESLNNSIAELAALLNHYSCEPSRSGISISNYLSNISELMALANLLRYIIRFKAGKSAYEKLCNTPVDGSNALNDNDVSDIAGNLSVENIGSIIAETIESDVEILTDDKGNPTAFIVDKDNKNKDSNPNNLSFYSCNLEDFTNSVKIPNIIKEIVDHGIPTDNIPGLNNGGWTITITPEDKFTTPPDDKMIVPIRDDNGWDLPDHIKNIISLINKYDGTVKNPKTEADIIFVNDDYINKLINKKTPSLPTSNTVTNPDGTTTAITTNGTEDITPRQESESVRNIVATLSPGKNLGINMLDCASDEELSNILNNLGGDI